MTATSLDLSQIKTDALSSASTFRSLIGLGSTNSPIFSSLNLTGRINLNTKAYSSADPAISWKYGSGTNSGLYGANNLFGIVQVNFEKVRLENNSWKMAANVSLGWSNTSNNAVTADLLLFRDTANTLAQRNGTNAQTFNIYNTYTSSTSYERGFMRWNSNVLEIGTEAGSGGGTLRYLKLNGGPSYIQTNGSGMQFYTPNGDYYLFTASNQYYMTIAGRGPSGKQSQFAISIGGGQSASNAIHVCPGRPATDTTAKDLYCFAGDARAGNITNITGAKLHLSGGDGTSDSIGDAHGGNVLITGGTGYGTGHDGYVVLSNLPSTDPAVAGAIWNNGGIASLSNGGASYTTSTPFTINQTWNEGTTTFTGFKLNVTDTASASGSLLMDLQVGGSSKFKVDKTGATTIANRLIATDGDNRVETSSWAGAGWVVRSQGNQRVGLGGGGIRLTNGASVAFCNDPSLNNPEIHLIRDAANTLAQRNSTNAQTFRLYNTYTSSTSFERLNVRWATNELIIDAEAGSGGGTLRGIKLGSATTSLLGFYGVTPVDQPLTVSDPAGGAIVDSEARTAIGEIIDRLQELGLIA